MTNTMLVVSDEKLDQILQQIVSLSQIVQTLTRGQIQPETQDIIDIKEAALLTGFKASYIYELKMKGIIPCFKVGKSLRFRRSELENWITAGRSNVMQQGINTIAANYAINKGSK